MALLSYALSLGFLVNFISESVLVGFSTGAAVYIAATQLSKLFGIAGIHGHFFDRILDLTHHIGATNVWALSLGIGGLVILLVGERIFPRLPWALILVLGSIGLMHRQTLPLAGYALWAKSRADFLSRRCRSLHSR